MANIFYLTLLLSVLISLAKSVTLFNLQYLPTEKGGVCMDESPAGIYTYLPEKSENPPNKILIYFEDIWQYWCTKETLAQSTNRCYDYVNDESVNDHGSSKNWSISFKPLEGILSDKSSFNNWPKALIRSCDGGSYFSDSYAFVKNKHLHFRGYKYVLQAINYLSQKGLLFNRDQVVIVGVANGGLAALAYADYIRENVNTNAKIRVIVDGGIWQNELFEKKNPVFQNRMKMIGKLFLNGNPFPNKKCQDANVLNIEHCFYASQLVKHVNPATQIMFLQSYYDTWQAQYILGLNCTYQFSSLNQCTSDHKQIIQDYHKKISTSMQSLAIMPNVGVWGIACVAQFMTILRLNNTDFEVPMNSNNTVQAVLQKWVNSSSSDKFKLLDTVSWPDNKPCQKQLKKVKPQKKHKPMKLNQRLKAIERNLIVEN